MRSLSTKQNVEIKIDEALIGNDAWLLMTLSFVFFLFLNICIFSFVIANEGFGLGDGTGPAKESKRTKRVQGWSRQIGLGTLFAIHTKLFSI